jgi:hypothetical protein
LSNIEKSMKYILSLFYCIIFSAKLVYAQDTLANSEKHKRLMVGINFSSDYNYRTLKNNNNNEDIDDIVESSIKLRDEMDIGDFGFTTGFNFFYYLRNRIGLELGIQYSRKGYKTKKESYDSGHPLSPFEIHSKFHYHYIDVPVRVNFMFGKKRIRISPSLGFATNIFLKKTNIVFLEFSDNSVEKTSQNSFENNRLNVSPIVGMGIDYKLNEKMFLRAEGLYRHGLLKIRNTPLTEYLWNYGLNLGLYYAVF